MNDTVTKLMGLADDYADWAEAKGKGHCAREEARQALQDELVRLFTPLTDEQLESMAYGFGGVPAPHLMFAREIEVRHGIHTNSSEVKE